MEGLKIQVQKIFLLNIKPPGTLLHKEMPGEKSGEGKKRYNWKVFSDHV